MSTVTATVNAGAGTVKLTITPTSGNVNTVTRADVNGTRAVRLPAGTLPYAGTLTVTDYEPALAGPVHYRVTTSAGPASVWVTLGATAPRFVLPQLPLPSVEVSTVFEYEAARASTATVHEVLGRVGPIITQAKLGSRRGSLSILCEDHRTVLNLDVLFGRGQTVFYRQAENPGQDMYFYAMAVSWAPTETGQWELSLDYVEVDYPAGPILLDPAWTFAALADTGGSFAATAQGYESFAALRLRETS